MFSKVDMFPPIRLCTQLILKPAISNDDFSPALDLIGEKNYVAL